MKSEKNKVKSEPIKNSGNKNGGALISKTKETKKDDLKPRLDTINGEILAKLKELQGVREGRKCYPFLVRGTSISNKVVDDVFDELRQKYGDCDGRLDVLVYSSGGSIDAAYNLALLLRRYANKELTFIVGRWAKSAATLLVCGGIIY